MKYVIDRFEEQYAILENIESKEIKVVTRYCLPTTSLEGTVLYFDGKQYSIDEETTNKRKEEILLKFQRLKNTSN